MLCCRVRDTGIDRHATEQRVGLFSTVLSRADYDMMAGKQAASMIADAPAINDVPNRPYFVNLPVEEETIIQVQKIKKDAPKPVPVVKPTKSEATVTQRPFTVPITPTYRPSFVPPTPTVQQPKREAHKVDVSKVTPGNLVKHKAFGDGTVKELTTGKDGTSYVIVCFGKVDKQFAFPGAFYQGFLSVKE